LFATAFMVHVHKRLAAVLAQIPYRDLQDLVCSAGPQRKLFIRPRRQNASATGNHAIATENIIFQSAELIPFVPV